MITPKNHAQENWLPKRNNRWKWMAGATAASAAVATGAHAQIVQINLINDQVNSLSGVNVNPNLAGTGPVLTNLFGQTKHSYLSRKIFTAQLGFRLPGVAVGAGAEATVNGLFVAGISITNLHIHASGEGRTEQSESLFIPFTITSANVNNGESTNALLEDSAFNTSYTDNTVALTRIVYDLGDPQISSATLESDVNLGTSYTVIGSTQDGVYSAEAAPEPSTLGLLALGAGGLLARRRLLKKAA